MFVERKYLDDWFHKIMERFDSLESRIVKVPEKERPVFDSEHLLDNQDLCIMLNISKRTLQRYRSLGWLPYRTIDQKSFYLQSEVETFVKEKFQQRRKKKKD
jgi:hypothetical protein